MTKITLTLDFELLADAETIMVFYDLIESRFGKFDNWERFIELSAYLADIALDEWSATSDNDKKLLLENKDLLRWVNAYIPHLQPDNPNGGLKND